MGSNPSYGYCIRRERKFARLTQKELADKAGIAVNSLKRYESNERTPRIDDLDRIAKALGITREGLLSGNEPITVTLTEPDGSTSQGILVQFPKGHPMHVPTLQETEEERRSKLLSHFNSLNYFGQGKAVERIEDLTFDTRYKKED